MKEWKRIEASNFAEHMFLYYTINWFDRQVWKILLDFLIQSWIFPYQFYYFVQNLHPGWTLLDKGNSKTVLNALFNAEFENFFKISKDEIGKKIWLIKNRVFFNYFSDHIAMSSAWIVLKIVEMV